MSASGAWQPGRSAPHRFVHAGALCMLALCACGRLTRVGCVCVCMMTLKARWHFAHAGVLHA
eukprot:354480-Chlamydomonas_euryale.AAC.3